MPADVHEKGFDHPEQCNEREQSWPSPPPSCSLSPQPSSRVSSDGCSTDSVYQASNTCSEWSSAGEPEGIQRFTLLHELGRCRHNADCNSSAINLNLEAITDVCQKSVLKRCCLVPDRGSSGTVSLAVEVATGRQVAIKQIPVGPCFKAEAVLRELENQQLCRGHPHIIQLQVSCTPM